VPHVCRSSGGRFQATTNLWGAMQIVDTYHSSGGLTVLNDLGQAHPVSTAVTQKHLEPQKRVSRAIKAAIQSDLSAAGWAIDVRLELNRGPSINALHHSGIALQVQVGNMARAFYDLMKLEAAWRLGSVVMGILVLPTSRAARQLGDNIANFERVSEEHESLFHPFIKLPLVIHGFE